MKRECPRAVLVGVVAALAYVPPGPMLAHPSAGAALGTPAQAPRAALPDIAGLASVLAQVGDRVRSYYERITSITCAEVVTQQELNASLRPTGKPREFVYDLIVTRDMAPAGSLFAPVRVERQIKLRNGQPVGSRHRPGCTDPQPVYGDPLAFLLAENRGGFRFALRVVSDAPPDQLVVDFEQIEPEPTKISWEGNCFTASGGRSVGRIWIDAATHDVLQLNTRLAEPFRLPGPPALPPASGAMTVERSEMAVRFTRVAFQDPEETLLLPESIVTVTTVRGAETPRMRTVQTFRDFRRFMTDGRMR